MENKATEKTAEQKKAVAILRSADVLLSQARYLTTREDVSEDGLDWISAPDFRGAINSIDKVIGLLEDAKAVLTEEDQKQRRAGEQAGIVPIPKDFWKPYDDRKQELAEAGE